MSEEKITTPTAQDVLDVLAQIKEEGQKALSQFMAAASVKTFSTEVYCTLQVEATHNWPGCPFDEVDYLRVPHRHLFGIKAYVAVNHDDRDVEFIMLKHQIQAYFREMYYDGSKQLCVFGAKSCEMLGKELIEKFNLTRCEVDEDGENGAIVTVHVPTHGRLM
jgi:hypothetical protein